MVTCPTCKETVEENYTRLTKHGIRCWDCIAEHIDVTSCLSWCSDCYYQFIDEITALFSPQKSIGYFEDDIV